MSLPGGSEIIIVLLIVMLIFGASRLPKLARSMGQAGREFKSGLREGFKDDDVSKCDACGVETPAEAGFCPSCGQPATAAV
ncbi:MAG: twin-arginine translocase TatA/TatE family subunit [Actinomycetota bacterium]